MFKPQFTTTPVILKNLLEIERLYGRLESLSVPRALLLDLNTRNLISSSYSSTRIEGNPMTKLQVTNLILDDRVPANRDEKEIRNYYDILSDIPKYAQQAVDSTLALDVHRRLLTGVQDEIAGTFRNERVVVGSHVRDEKNRPALVIKHDPPYHQQKQIAHAINELSEWIKESSEQAFIKAGIFHHQFQFLHPFVDGNGRVGRLLTAVILFQSGYYINRFFVLDDYYDIDRAQYSDKLHSADSGELSEWLEYFTDGVKYSLKSALAKVEEGLNRLDVEQRPTRREQEVLTFVTEHRQATAEDIARTMDVSRQQAHALLSALVEKGYVKKIGTTKGSYYMLE